LRNFTSSDDSFALGDVCSISTGGGGGAASASSTPASGGGGKGKARASGKRGRDGSGVAIKDEAEEEAPQKGGGAAAASSSLSSAANSSHRDAWKRVAESRAAHFARADSSDRVRIRPVRSSTPLPGTHRPKSGDSMTWVFIGIETGLLIIMTPTIVGQGHHPRKRHRSIGQVPLLPLGS